MAGVFGATGSRHALIVHADDGLDELSVTSPADVLEVRGDGAGAFEVTAWRVDPRALGLPPATMEDLRGGNAAFNAGVIRSVLEGEQGARRDIGILNAAAALDGGGTGRGPGERAGAGHRVDRQRPGPGRARRAGHDVPRRVAPAAGLTRQLRRGPWVSGSSAGESGRHSARTHPPNPPPLMRAPRTPGRPRRCSTSSSIGRQRDPEVGGQAAVPLGHDGAQPAEVAPGQQPLRLSHPGTFGDDVTGPPAQDGIGEPAEVAERAEAERPAQDVRRPLALGAPGGVGSVGEEARRLTVDDHESRLVGNGHLAGLEVVEVDVERVAGGGAGDGERVEQADVGAGAALGLLAGAGQCQGIGVVAEGEQKGHREGGARGEAGTDRQGARDPGHPTARRRLQAQEPGRQGSLGAAPGRCRPA